MRSILFLPLDKIERVPKALGSNADKVIFDLEDGLAKDKKDFGRKNFIEFSKSNFDNQPEKFLLRINGLDSHNYNDDIKMLKSCPNLPYSIAIPKIEDAKECQSFLNDLGKDILVLPQIETPKGIANIEFWDVEGIKLRDRIILSLEKTIMPSLSKTVCNDFFMTPKDFKKDYRSKHGAGFSIAPIFLQSAWFRYHNRDPHINNLYFAASGAHPGAGIPGVLSSAKVVENIILNE